MSSEISQGLLARLGVLCIHCSLAEKRTATTPIFMMPTPLGLKVNDSLYWANQTSRSYSVLLAPGTIPLAQHHAPFHTVLCVAISSTGQKFIVALVEWSVGSSSTGQLATGHRPKKGG